MSMILLDGEPEESAVLYEVDGYTVRLAGWTEPGRVVVRVGQAYFHGFRKPGGPWFWRRPSIEEAVRSAIAHAKALAWADEQCKELERAARLAARAEAEVERIAEGIR